jgi:beta-lactamase class A
MHTRTPVLLTLLLLLIRHAALSQPLDWDLVRQHTIEKLRSITNSTRSIVGISAVDLSTGESFGINDTLLFPQASAIKVPVLLEVMRQAGEGRFRLTDTLAVRPAAKVGGAGILQFFGDAASRLSIYDLCVLMIALSDNTATNMLIDLAGADNINATLHRLGMRHTRLQRKMMDSRASAAGMENISTPREATRLLQLLHHGQLISRRISDQMLAIMQIPKPVPGDIGLPLPDSVQIAWKAGELDGVRTEWAIVLLPERPYALSIMVKLEGNGEGPQAIRELSSVLFGHFWRLGRASRYGVYVDPPLLR